MTVAEISLNLLHPMVWLAKHGQSGAAQWNPTKDSFVTGLLMGIKCHGKLIPDH